MGQWQSKSFNMIAGRGKWPGSLHDLRLDRDPQRNHHCVEWPQQMILHQAASLALMRTPLVPALVPSGIAFTASGDRS